MVSVRPVPAMAFSAGRRLFYFGREVAGMELQARQGLIM